MGHAMYKGATSQFRAKLYKDDGKTPHDLTGATITLYVTENEEQDPPTITKALNIDGAATEGGVEYKFLPADTSAIQAKKYQGQIKILTSGGDIYPSDPFPFVLLAPRTPL